MLQDLVKTWSLEPEERTADAIYSRLGIDRAEALGNANVAMHAFDVILEQATAYHIAQFDSGEEYIPDEYHTLLRILFYARQFVALDMTMHKLADPLVPDDVVDADIGVSRFATVHPTTKGKAKQNSLIFLYNELHKRGYRKYHNHCYVPIYTPDGHYTYAWEQKCTIEEFIYSSCDKETQFDVWDKLVSCNIQSLAEFIEKAQDIQFPTLIKNRHVFSFRNGVYLSKVKTVSGDYTDMWFPHGTPIDHGYLPPNEIACNHIDAECMFPKQTKDWYKDIPTPHLQRVLTYQFCREPEYENICRMMYVMLGRLLYNVNDLDTWQILPFLRGTAGTGKSLIATKVAQHFFHAQDVGTVSNNTDKTFGLSGFHDKFVFIAPEIRASFNMDQATFQSIISGESVVVRKLYKKPYGVEWNVPGIMCGNETPNFTNSSGSLSRRWFLFRFAKKVRKDELDPQLDRKIMEELPTIIVKCNRAYQEFTKRYGSRNIWDVVPEYFLKNQQMISEQTNSLYNFLESGAFVFGKDKYCPKDYFLEQYNRHCMSNGMRKCKFIQEIWEGPFGDLGAKHDIVISVSRREKNMYRGNVRTGAFIHGFDFHEEITEPDVNFID